MVVPYGDWFGAIERQASRICRRAVLAVALGLAMAGPSFAQGAVERPLKLVALGDSLTAGYGLPASAAFPAKLQKALRDKGITVEISNAGVSGDTTSGGLARLDWSLPKDVDGVILELGANDALRGIDPQVARQSLEEILKRLKARNIPVLLCGMYAPPNYGPQYAAKFNAIYPELAKQYEVPLYPFFLEGVATVERLNQPDGLHPTEAGVEAIVANILPTVEAFIGAIRRQRG
ncbi:arylesterase [Rhodopseudomonas pseudopalustris]|uniref:arylesterase n=1 Tax=Rhodopseudomonas pseudopalustris TaxID=1513892 RepID=UPI000C9EF693